MEVKERPMENYTDIGSLDKQIEELAKAIVLPMEQADKFKNLGIKPPKGVLMYGPPGTGKMLLARACALVQSYVYDRDPETARKAYVQCLFARMPEQIAEEDMLFLVAKKLEQNECRFVRDHDRLLRNLAGINLSLPNLPVDKEPFTALGALPVGGGNKHKHKSEVAELDSPSGMPTAVKKINPQTNACSLKLVGPSLVQMFIGDGTKLVHDAFELAKEKVPAIIFIDELDAMGTKRFDSKKSGDCEVFAATNRIDILDPALLCSSRLDHKIGFPLLNEGTHPRILQIQSRKMTVGPEVNFDELACSMDKFNAAPLKAVAAATFAVITVLVHPLLMLGPITLNLLYLQNFRFIEVLSLVLSADR
ncbi:P-loop containing nucleoside triphosphate hydrolase protein [Auricularia subglabra TFB-10046 SS5]|uniref:p-loop containing nucleoside triphosphate hydrolase protein n=1 Tax=Auricularia subglabra (strain TFB-10046 / SS5) TaxID=717982 RepID=J0D9D4_AURST|nr:P-loop containing nucleoside triphosphate hydrolase protein [Auricularia subglabra TFB-10046 SS5]